MSKIVETVQAHATLKANKQYRRFPIVALALSPRVKTHSVYGKEDRVSHESPASALYAGRIPVFVSPSQTDIENDISKQNLAGKPCHMAQIANGKISYKAHVFHRVGG